MHLASLPLAINAVAVRVHNVVAPVLAVAAVCLMTVRHVIVDGTHLSLPLGLARATVLRLTETVTPFTLTVALLTVTVSMPTAKVDTTDMSSSSCVEVADVRGRGQRRHVPQPGRARKLAVVGPCVTVSNVTRRTVPMAGAGELCLSGSAVVALLLLTVTLLMLRGTVLTLLTGVTALTLLPMLAAERRGDAAHGLSCRAHRDCSLLLLLLLLLLLWVLLR